MWWARIYTYNYVQTPLLRMCRLRKNQADLAGPSPESGRGRRSVLPDAQPTIGGYTIHERLPFFVQHGEAIAKGGVVNAPSATNRMPASDSSARPPSEISVSRR